MTGTVPAAHASDTTPVTAFDVALFGEAMLLLVADRVIFMAEGRIVEQAPPKEFFSNPQNEKTRTFLGQILSSNHA